MKIFISAIAAMLLFIACDKNNGADQKQKTQDVTFTDANNKPEAGILDFSADTAIAPPAPPDITDKKKQPITTQPTPHPDWNKKIIKNAALNFEVKDYKSFYASFREKVKSVGGYVAQEEQTQSEYKIENTIAIKVPVDQFDNAVNLLSANAEKINEKKITSQDVTTEFVDTRSRIESKKQVRERYIDLLKQAKNMEEILNVQSEINGIQEEIESASGRIQYLGHSSAFSTINLTYYQVLNSAAVDNEKPSFGKEVASAFKTGWSWVTDLFVALVSIWPLFIVSFFAYLLYKKMKPIKPKKA